MVPRFCAMEGAGVLGLTEGFPFLFCVSDLFFCVSDFFFLVQDDGLLAFVSFPVALWVCDPILPSPFPGDMHL